MFNTLCKNHTVQEAMWKNMIHPDRLLKMHSACPKMKARTHTYTIRTFNTYCFSWHNGQANTPLICTLPAGFLPGSK